MHEAIVNQNVFELVDRWLEAEANGEKFPVPFDIAWSIAGYSRKDSAKRKLAKFSKGADFHTLMEVVERPQGGGTKVETFYLTCDTFKHFCLLAETNEGRQIRQYFIEAEKKYRMYSQKPKSSLEVLVMQTRSLAEYAEEMLALQQKQDALIEAQNQLQIQTEEIKQKQSVFEVRQQNLKNTVRQTENRVDRIDSELERFIDPDGGFYTVRAFAKNHNINVTMSDAISLGKLAKRASEQMGYRIGKVKDVRFGQVNAYHEDVLEQVFDAALT